MAKDKAGDNPPAVREIGDAPHITRLLKHKPTVKTFYSSWSSPEAFADHIGDINPSSVWYTGDNIWNDCTKSFVGVDSLGEAIDLCVNGWKEGGETIEKTRGYIQALNPVLPKPLKYAIAGSTPNVPRAIAGNILNMRAPEEGKSGRRPVITIVYNMCENCGIDQQSITNKAAVTAALVDEIEAKGFATEVIAVAYSGGGWSSNMEALTSVVVKPSNQPVDTNRLAFSLGHSAMFRALIFADWEADHFCSDLGRGLGCPKSTQPNKDDNDRDIYVIRAAVGNMGKDFGTIEKAADQGVKFIIKELRKQGCPAFPKMKDHEDDLDEEPLEEEEEELPY